MKLSQTAVSLTLAFVVLSAGIPAFTGQAGAQSSEGGYVVYADSVEVVKVSEGQTVEWTVTRYTNPMGVATYQGYVFVAHDGGVSKLDGSDGSEVWTYSGVATVEKVTVGESGAVFAADDSSSHNITRIDQDGNEVWSVDTLSDHANDIKANHSVLAVAGSDGSVYRLDKSDGSDVWSDGGHGSFVSQVDVDPDGNVFGGGADEMYYLLDSADGSTLWTDSNPNADNYWSVAVNSGEYYAGDGGEVHRIDDTGTIQYQQATGLSFVNGLEVGDELYAGYSELQKRQRSDGAEIWSEPSTDNIDAIAYQGQFEISTPTPSGTPTTTPTGTPFSPPDDGGQGFFTLIEGFLAFVGLVIGVLAAIAAFGSRSMSVGSVIAYVTFAYLAIETQHTFMTQILTVSLVLVIIGMAFKLWRLEMGGDV